MCTYFQNPFLMIHAYQIHVEVTQHVKTIMGWFLVLAYRNILELLPTVDLNAPSTQSVRQQRVVFVKNVSTLVKTYVDKTLSAELLIMHQSVLAEQVTKEIHLLNAQWLQVRIVFILHLIKAVTLVNVIQTELNFSELE